MQEKEVVAQHLEMEDRSRGAVGMGFHHVTLQPKPEHRGERR